MLVHRGRGVFLSFALALQFLSVLSLQGLDLRLCFLQLPSHALLALQSLSLSRLRRRRLRFKRLNLLLLRLQVILQRLHRSSLVIFERRDLLFGQLINILCALLKVGMEGCNFGILVVDFLLPGSQFLLNELACIIVLVELLS